MTLQRSGAVFDEEQAKLVIHRPDMHYHDLNSMSSAFFLENIMVMYRRCMLGCMIDPTASVVAIVLTALEEAILRSTMVYRDHFIDRLMDRPEPTEAELEHKVRVSTFTVILVCYLGIGRRLDHK